MLLPSRSSTPSASARSSAWPSSARRRSPCCCAASSAGFAIPPTSSVLRSMWTDLLEPRLHQAAYALDSTMIELIFISGPLLTAVIAAVTSPAGALIVSAVAVVDRHGDLHRAAADARTSRASEEHPAPRAARRAHVARACACSSSRRSRPASASACSRSASPPSAARGRRGNSPACCWPLVVRPPRRRPRLRDAPAPLAVPDAPGARRRAAARRCCRSRSRRTCGRWRCS